MATRMVSHGGTTFGQIAEFQPDVESFETYEERIRLFLRANEIPDERAVAVVLSVIGAANFSLLHNLLSPDKPSEKSVDEILAVLKGHFAQD